MFQQGVSYILNRALSTFMAPKNEWMSTFAALGRGAKWAQQFYITVNVHILFHFTSFCFLNLTH